MSCFEWNDTEYAKRLIQYVIVEKKCPLQGKSREKSILYTAKLTTNKIKVGYIYIGVTGETFQDYMPSICFRLITKVLKITSKYMRNKNKLENTVSRLLYNENIMRNRDSNCNLSTKEKMKIIWIKNVNGLIKKRKKKYSN